MAGIVSCGAYIPVFKVSKETVGWGLPAEKAVANFDEDAITMGAAAAIDCLKGLDRSKVDAIYFATTSSPYAEKQAASIIANAADLRRDIFATDITDTLRSGTIAMKLAMDAIKSGSAKQVLVVAADRRQGPPRSASDQSLGDAAAAVLLGDTGVIASVDAVHSLNNEIVDTWRDQGDPFVRNWEDRFVVGEGYQRTVRDVVVGLMEKAKLTPKDIARAALYGPDARSHAALAASLGLDPKTQVQPSLIGTVGSTGAAHSLLLLVAALEQSKAGDRILVAGYGDGADAFVLKVTDAIAKAPAHRGVKGHLAYRRTLKNYDDYLKARNFIPTQAAARPPVMPPSPTALWRERDQNLRLYGGRCQKCGYLQYPPQKVCTKCHNREQFTSERMSETATLYTYSMDYIAGSIDVPLIISVINFDGGGRMLTTMTDRDIDEVKVGMHLEMSFRQLFAAGGIHNYYWKVVPIRENIPVKK